MKIVIAPDSFKGSLTALEVAQAIEEGLRRVAPDVVVDKVPMADGGEGTVQSLVDATNGQIIVEQVTGPLGNKIDAGFGILGDGKTAVIEMAAASGLPLVPIHERNPMKTTTYGTGELIRAALDRGCRELIVGIGGSATVDGGTGMAQALGAKLLDASGSDISFGGEGLAHLAHVDISTLDPRIAETRTRVACDVDNPLVGPEGAPAVYGPQKGATPDMVKQLDRYLDAYAAILQRDLGREVKDIPGAGAAGGLGAGLVAFLNAELMRGIDIVIEASHLADYMKDADLVITGEGQIDDQTAFGKTPIGVAKTAKRFGIPVIAIGGSIADSAGAVYEHGIDGLMTIVNGPMALEEAMQNGAKLIADATERMMRLVLLDA